MKEQILTCRKCSAVDCIDVQEKSGHHIAYCAACGAYIKHLPTQEPKFYFGKYKGWKVADVEDAPYLSWALQNIKLGATARQAVIERLNSLKLVQR